MDIAPARDATPPAALGTRHEQRSSVWVWVAAACVGVLAAGMSAARVLTRNPETFSTVLFAEDGIFPLCVLKVGAVACLADPYAGYLATAPRLLGTVVALSPLDSWAVVANSVAAVSVGVLAVVVFVSLVRGLAMTWVWAALVALLPAAAPIVGFEAVNVYASVYMPLLFTMLIVLVSWTPRRGPWWAAGGVFLSAVTIPLAVVLVVPLAVVAWRKRIRPRSLWIVSGGLFAGLLLQGFVMVTASHQRDTTITFENVRGWVDALPVAVGTVWPGVSFGESTVFGIFTTPVQTLTGWFLLLVGCVVAGWLLIRRDARRDAAAVLIVAGVFVGAVPAVTGDANNRYFVLPVLLWLAAGMILVAARQWRNPTVAGVVTAAVLVFVWAPAFPSSPWRVHASPPWNVEAQRIIGSCAANPDGHVDVVFTPDWPMPHVEVFEPTTGRLPCALLP